MAEQEAPSKDKPLCSICVDVFREPVSLPCNHSFCRQCLQLFADKSNPKSKDCTAVKSPRQQINCPLCRSSTLLPEQGVSALPPNTELSGEAANILSEDMPVCSLCGDDSKSLASRFCSTCGVLYCEKCLEICHPAKGPLKRHTLQTVDQYLSRNKARLGEGSSPSCEEHKLPLCQFCTSCRLVMCRSCVCYHPALEVLNISTASHREKVRQTDRHILYKIILRALGLGS